MRRAVIACLFMPITLMAQESESVARSTKFEMHVQTILISIITVVITGALMFSANYFYTDNQSKAVQKTQLEMLTGQVIEMRADLRSLQTNYVKREEYKELELRMRDMERRLGSSR